MDMGTSSPISDGNFPHLKRTCYSFDGHGNVELRRDWDLQETSCLRHDSTSFSWYHVELPRSISHLSSAAQYLIEALCPPLKLQDILSLISNGPFCAHVDGALIFRVNSAGPTASKYTHKLAVRVCDSTVIIVALGRIPRLLGFLASSTKKSLLNEVPLLAEPGTFDEDGGDYEEMKRRGTHIQEHMLEFLLTMNYHSESADSPVPSCISNLIVHLIDAHVDQLQDVAARLEMDLDEVELELDNGGFILKQKMLDDRFFPRMNLDIQRLLQVIAHGEQVFPRVKDKCTGKAWITADDAKRIDTLVGHLQKLKENLGFLSNRVTTLQAGLDSWQSEQINRKLYYLSFLSIIFLPLSIVTAVFGMNVGGIPWSESKTNSDENGFRNVLLLCAAILLLLLACFWTGPLINYVKALHLKKTVREKWLNTKKSIKWKGKNGLQHAGYFRL